jgi:tetratricopeptide (TPR) repeat protein/serine/threonine protein kinase/predicted ATPase
LNPPDDLLEAIAKRMGISVADATEIVSMVESNAATHPESAPQLPQMDSGDTFFFEKEGGETTQTVEITQPTEELPIQNLGRYHNLGSLGIGGMGEVRKVLDPSLNRVVALKVIHPHLMTMPALVNRFVEEAQIQANLQHPNIVPIYEIGRLEDNRPFFTMGLVQDDPYSEQIDAVHKAASATQWHATPKGTTFRDLIHTFHQVCVTVAFAHAQGVIHRDLKPDNILIGRFGQVLVVDWGLAKFIGASDENESTLEQIDTLRPRVGSNQTQVGSVSGTPAYMSPEQARGEAKKLGPPTDVYALGAILYQILSGNAPFKGSSSAAILEQVRKHGPKDNLVLDKIPPPLRALCQSAMERNQAERTLSAQGLAQGLKGWLEGAEKRDKGLHELENAREVLAEIQRFESQAAAEWKQANALIQSEGAESIAGWKSWNKNKATQVKIRGLRDHHRRALQGALVHAPDLEEAHNALAQLVLVDIIRAHALGDLRAEGVFVQQFTGHLDYLGPLAREKLEAQLDHGRSDPIAGRRMRQGVIVGRHTQRQSIGEHFRSGNRLVTLLGTAGVGKTRLALEVAEDLQDLEHKVVFCDLTEATDELGIARRLARTLDVRLRDMDPMAHLCEILSAQRSLLILDNLEQVRETIGPLIQKWVNNTEHLLILTTSRVRLMVEVETVVSVQPLALLESVDLFVVRGQSVSPRFALTSANRIQICQIVRQLDGLPLAIELAAARLKLLTLDEIGTHLSNRFGLLRSSGKDARALDTALDWSWSLLEPWAKAALSQASLFHGGFNLAAATGVIQKGEIKDAPEIFDVLGGLVDNSLLRLDHSDSGVRYSLLESIRVYANNKLSDPTEGDPTLWGPEAQISAQQHHAAYFSKFGNPASLRALKGFKSSAQWDGLFLELDNLVAAIDYGTPESAPLCCLAALKVLGMKGPVALGVDIATQVMKMPGLNRRAYSLLEIERGKCLRISGRMGEARSMVHSLPLMQMVAVEAESETKAEEPELLSREAGLLEAARLMELGNIERAENKYVEAEKCYRGALAIFQKHGERAGEGEAIGQSGAVHREKGQHDRAVEHFIQALDIAREIGNKRNESMHLGNLGIVYKIQGQHDRAVAHYKQAIEIASEIGDKRLEGEFLGNLGNAYKARGLHDQAAKHYGQAIDMSKKVGTRVSECTNLGNLGDALVKMEQLSDAEAAFRKAISIGDETQPAAAGAFRGSLALLLAQQDQIDEAQALLEIGEPQVETYPAENAKFLCKKGQVQILAGEPEAAQKSLDQAKAIAAKHKLGDDGEVAEAIAELTALLDSPDDPDEPDEPPGEEREDALIEAARLMELGNIERAESKYAEAEQCYRSALAIFQKHSDRAGEGGTIGSLGIVYQQQGQHDRAIAHYTQAINIAQEIGDKRSEGISLSKLGEVYEEQGQYDRAAEHFTQAIDIAREIGDKRFEGIHLGNLGIIYQAQGQYDQATEHFTQAIDIAKEIGDKGSEGIFLGNLGIVSQKQGQVDRAAEHFTQAIDIAREVGDKRNEGIFLGNLGNVYQEQGQHDRASEHYTQAIDIAREVGDKRFECMHLGNLGDILFQQNRLKEAEDAFRETIAIGDKTFPIAAGAFRGSLAVLLAQKGQGDEAQALLKAGEPQVVTYPAEHAKFLCKKGQVQILAGEPEAAQKSLDQAKALATEHKFGDEGEVAEAIAELTALLGLPDDPDKPDKPDKPAGEDREDALIEAERLMELGNIEKAESKYAEAKQCFRSALELFQKHGDRAGEGEAIGNLGGTYRVQGQLGRATEHYTQAIDIAKEIGDKSIEGRNFGNLGTVYEEQGQHDRAAEHFTQAINIAREIGSKRGEGIMLGNLGNVYREQGQYDRAAEHHTQAIDIAREVGDKRSEGIHLGNLGDVYKQQGQHDRAVEHFTRAIDIAREVGDKRNEALNLGILGIVCKFQRQYDRAVDYFTQAIDIAREIGDKRFECMHLGNLGDILFQQNRLEEAENAFRKAIHIGDKTLPGAAGAFRGSLALLLAQQGQIVETQELLKIGEAQVETYPSELAKFVGKKGQVQLLASDLKAAQASLDRAIALVTEHKLENDVEVAQAISELEGLISHSN